MLPEAHCDEHDCAAGSKPHRRVRFEALMQYKRRADAERRGALDELAAYDQELGI